MTDVPSSMRSTVALLRSAFPDGITYGDSLDASGAARTPTVSTMTYDLRRRPVTLTTVRAPTASPSPLRPLAAVTVPFAQALTWDPADNLTAISDLRDGDEWPAGFRPQSTSVMHDALYRVVRADYTYVGDGNTTLMADTGTDWRVEAALSRPNDPMASRPAGMAGTLPASRPTSMDWEYDWLGNMQSWEDDAGQIYERSLGDIFNGFEAATMERPSALRVAANLGAPDATGDRGGYVEVDYGEAGEVRSFTVHAVCRDAPGQSCVDTMSPYPATRLSYLNTRCRCEEEQHYFYQWDEVMRISQAFRWDRTGGSTGTWTMMVRQRYLYDSANERTVKQTLDLDVMSSTPEAISLYVYPGDFERRGLVRGTGTYTALPGAETQYVVGGARLVYRTSTRSPTTGIDRDQRLTIGLTDLIQSTSATLDLYTGELVETSNYYANGARESYRGSTAGDRVAPEPTGFTGKEADEEVGLVYFGQRYLLAHLGRWASPDPLQVHAVGGGEALNGYHYVAGNVLQARDPVGLDISFYQRTTSSYGSPHSDAVRRELAANAVEQAGGIQEDLLQYFAIETTVVTADAGSPEGFVVGLRLSGSDTSRVIEMHRQIYDRALNGETSVAAVERAKNAIRSWDAARNRLMGVLEAPSDAAGCSADLDHSWRIELTTRGDAMAVPLAGALHDTVSGRTFYNPLWYAGLEGDAAALESRGPLFDLLHESDHKWGCLVGGGCVDSTYAEGIPWNRGETATTSDVDGVLRALGLPTRGAYDDSEWLNDHPRMSEQFGRRIEMQTGDEYTTPTLDEASPDHARWE